MQDLDKALADITAIRSQMARGAEFRGYGPATIAATGVLAIAAATLQAFWLPDPATQLLSYLALWVATALLSVILIGSEMVARTRRIHRGLADEMIHAATEQFSHGRAAHGRALPVRAGGSVDAAGALADRVQPRPVRRPPLAAAADVRGRGLVPGDWARKPRIRERRTRLLAARDGGALWAGPALHRRGAASHQRRLRCRRLVRSPSAAAASPMTGSTA